MMVTVLDIPIPVTTECGDGYILYIKSNGFLENDEFAVVLLDGGKIKHFASDQVKVWNNATYGIKKKTNEKETSQEATEGISSPNPSIEKYARNRDIQRTKKSSQGFTAQPKIKHHMIFSPDKNGQIDGTVKRILDQIQTDRVLVPITRLNDYVFNESLYDLKEWILVDYFEYGANHWDRKETHFWGKNTADFSYVPKTEEWEKFDKFCKDNPPTKILKRELLKKDVADNVLPVEYPSFYVVPDPQTKEEYEKRPIEVFHFWGHSHEIRRAFHGGCFILAAQTGIGVVDNIDYIERSLGEYKRLWVTVNTPHFARRPMEQIYAINGMSKLSVSLEGAGIKCFRHAEASLNSLMVMRQDNLAWSYDWETGVNCIRLSLGRSIEDIKGVDRDSYLKPIHLNNILEYTAYDFYELYRNGINTAKKYQLDNYINNYLQPIINQ